MFKTIPVYIKIMRDKVEVSNLNTGETVYEAAEESFSTDRNVIAKIDKAEKTLKTAFCHLGITGGLFPPRLKMLVQQTEAVEGGLNDIEKRALMDVAQLAGQGKVYLSEHTRKLSLNEAMDELTGKSK